MMKNESLFQVYGLDSSKFKAEPTIDEIENYMEKHQTDYYNAREKLREETYGGKPPVGFSSWGDFWKYGI